MMTTMETIAMVMSNIGDDAAFGRVVRALMEAHLDEVRAKADAYAREQVAALPAPSPVPTLSLVPVPEAIGRSHGKTFDGAFGKALAAAVRANGGRVQWTSRHIMEHVPGYRGNTARAIGNAMGQWARAWKAGGTTFYGLRVVDVTFNQRVDARASAVYVIETAPVAKTG
jgi:hypothetical protein